MGAVTLATKVPTTDTAKAGFQVGYLGTGFAILRATRGKSPTAASGKATKIRSARGLSVRAGTASLVEVSLTDTTPAIVQLAVKVPVGASTTATVESTYWYGGFFVVNRAFRSRPATATSSRAVRLVETKRYAAKSGSASGAKALLGVQAGGGAKTFDATAGTGSSAKATVQSAYWSGGGFIVARALRAEAPTFSDARATVTVTGAGVGGDEEGFNVTRDIHAGLTTATSATATVQVSYYGSGGFLILRTIRAKVTTSAFGHATTVGELLEAFRVRRPVRTKTATADRAWATTISYGSYGPGFIVARAMVAATPSVSSAKARLATRRPELVRVPTAAGARAAALARGVGDRARVSAASGASARTLTDRPLVTNAGSASSTKTAFLTTEAVGQASLGAGIGTATGATGEFTATRPLVATAATSSGANGLASGGRRFAGKAATASTVTGGPPRLTILHDHRTRPATATAAHGVVHKIGPVLYVAKGATVSGAHASMTVHPAGWVAWPVCLILSEGPDLSYTLVLTAQ